MRVFSRLGVPCPVLHFVAIGALLFGFDRWRNGAAEPTPILVSGDEVASLRRAWHEQVGREPDAAEERGLVAEAVDEEILYREALASGLDRADRIVQARLVDLARFLDVAPGSDAEVLAGAARRLDLGQRDAIVRRHLAEMARLALSKGDPLAMPSEAELQTYYERNAERFAHPARLELTHVYLSAARRGSTIDDQAVRLLGELRAQAIDPRNASDRGDLFVYGSHVALASRDEIERLFGPAFADVVDQAEVQTWVGPVRSTYGLHLVWIHRRISAQVPAYESVRNQVAHALLRERGAQRLQERLAALRRHYEVVVSQ